MNWLGKRLASMLLAGAVVFSSVSMDVLAASETADPAAITETEDESGDNSSETAEEADDTESTADEDKNQTEGTSESDNETSSEEDSEEKSEESEESESDKEDEDKSDKDDKEDSEDENSDKDDDAEEDDGAEDDKSDKDDVDEDEDSDESKEDEDSDEEAEDDSDDDSDEEESDDITVKKHTHIKEYISNEDGTHTATCSFEGCKYEVVQDCIFEKGVCKRCGYEEVVEAEALDYSETIGGYTIKLTAEAGVLPNDVEVTIKKVTAVAGVPVETLIEDAIEEEREIAKIVSFDISFSSDGEEVEPEEGSVNVSISLADEIKVAEEESENAEVKIFHVDDTAVVSEMVATVDGETAVFDAEEFSVFSIVVLNGTTNSGIWGDIYWRVTGSGTEGYTITFSGNGTMTEKYGAEYYPWYQYKENIRKVVVETGVSNIPKYAFNEYPNIVAVNISEGTTSIGDGAFGSCSLLTAVAFPNTLRKVGVNAFTKCKSLTTVSFGNKVTEIDDWAFYGCISLRSISTPGSLERIGYGAFKNCTALTNVSLANGLIVIDNEAFYGCSALKSVSLPETVSSVGAWAFYECSSIVEFSFPNGQISVGADVCKGCRSIKNLTIPGGVTTIPAEAFQGCTSLSTLTIKEGVSQINDWAFHGCTSLQSVTISNSVSTIGYGSFEKCTSLKILTLGSGVKLIDGEAFEKCSSLTGVEIPESVHTIGHSAFEECTELSNVILHEGLLKIDRGAFWNCKLKSIVIPESVSTMGDNSIPRDTIIYGKPGSCAQEYAVKYGNIFYSSTSSTYTIRFNGNGSTGGVVPSSMTLNFSQSATLPANTLTRAGYRFKGWALNSAGTGVLFADRATVSGLASTKGQTVVLYAIWTPNKYKVAFYGNGATSGTMSTMSCKVGTTYTLNANAFKKSGYLFGGWNTKADGSGMIYANKAQILNLSASNGVTVKLYAMWKPVAPTITAAANVNDGIKIAWGVVKGATAYYVYRSVGKGSFQAIAKTTKCNYTDTAATVNGGKYQYKVVAAVGNVKSDASAPTTMFRLSKPKMTSITNPKSGTVSTVWSANKFAYGWQVIYGTDSTFGTFSTEVVTPGTTITKAISKLKKGKTYYFKVRSYGVFEGKIYYSKWSTPASIKITK